MGAVDKIKVAVIEDNSDLCDMLVEDLRSAGYEVMGYGSVEAFKEEGARVDLFLLDVNLPGISGLDFAREIRSENRRLGIIVLSVRTGSNNRTEGYLSGVDLYLQKPCSSVELLAAIDRVSERVNCYSAATAHVDQHHRLIVDKLTLAGSLGAILLTPRETSLIAALSVANAQQLDFETCKSHYSQDKEIQDATLEVGVGRLRKKIESVTGAKQSIIAVRGVGYKLVLNITIE